MYRTLRIASPYFIALIPVVPLLPCFLGMYAHFFLNSSAPLHSYLNRPATLPKDVFLSGSKSARQPKPVSQITFMRWSHKLTYGVIGPLAFGLYRSVAMAGFTELQPPRHVLRHNARLFPSPLFVTVFTFLFGIAILADICLPVGGFMKHKSDPC